VTFPLYFDDDSESTRVSQTLADRGFDVLRATDAGMRGKADREHLEFAGANSRVLVTANCGDFLQLHGEFLRSGQSHAGMVIVLQQHYSIGEQLRRLERLLRGKSAVEMRDWVVFLSDWG
jgi:hypothetical protein